MKSTAQTRKANRQSVANIPIDHIHAHDSNIREELDDLDGMAISIKANGLIEPVVVTEHPTKKSVNGKTQYLLLAGHRRTAACKLAGMTKIPAVIRHDIGEDVIGHIVLMLVENCQRSNIEPLERAEAIRALMNRGMTQAVIAQRTGMKQAAISYYAMLTELDDETKDGIRSGDILLGDARRAVRAARQDSLGGKKGRGRPVQTEAPHFGSTHPLAKTIKGACTHTLRRKIGSIGCGQCWEDAIRADALSPAQTALEVAA